MKNKLKQKLIDYKKKQFDKARGGLENSVELFEAKITEGIVEELCEVINQLDEPETLSQEWIDENEIEFYTDTADAEMHVTFRLGDLQNLLVPVQELPVIPKFVADWIEFKKKSGISYENVFQAMDEVVKSHTSKAHNWVLKTNENKETFARAWLDGFTVEKEQKYYVLDSEEIPLLERANNQTCKTTTGLSIYEDGRDNSRFELTEQEIKGYDDRFWPFAVKVEEMEE